VKTLAVKLEEDVHARLTVLAKLSGTSLGELLKQAAEKFAAEAGTSPEFKAKAEQMLRTADREARERKAAIEALLKPLEDKPKAAKGRAAAKVPGNGK
jgi:ribosomal protein L12E/L44/L45/RPP1/RPP2